MKRSRSTHPRLTMRNSRHTVCHLQGLLSDPEHPTVKPALVQMIQWVQESVQGLLARSELGSCCLARGIDQDELCGRSLEQLVRMLCQRDSFKPFFLAGEPGTVRSPDPAKTDADLRQYIGGFVRNIARKAAGRGGKSARKQIRVPLDEAWVQRELSVEPHEPLCAALPDHLRVHQRDVARIIEVSNYASREACALAEGRTRKAIDKQIERITARIRALDDDDQQIVLDVIRLRSR